MRQNTPTSFEGVEKAGKNVIPAGEGVAKAEKNVTPAKAGGQRTLDSQCILDSRLRGNDCFVPFVATSFKKGKWRIFFTGISVLMMGTGLFRIGGFILLICSLFFGSTSMAQRTVVVVSHYPAATMHQIAGVESTQVMTPFKWHTKQVLDFVSVHGTEKKWMQSGYAMSLGFGLPGALELHLSLPVGVTVKNFDDNSDTGGGLGDLRTGLLYQVKGAPNGGVGLLLGALLDIPTGKNTIALGEGAMAFQPFMSFSLTSFSSSLTVNLGYHIRSQRYVVLRNGQLFEQDDDLVWRVALRIPKDEDIAWSLMASGTIGMATNDGLWPKSNKRPLWIGVGIDYPSWRAHRLGLFCRFLVNGPDTGIHFGVQWSGVAKDRDEDRDGILLRHDQCPLLREDMDGFKDDDGCPDLDNDMDSFPDAEDACPLKKGDEFSMDGC